MPTYTFRDPTTGGLEDHHMSIKEVPVIGDFYTFEDGRVMQRVFSKPEGQVRVAPDKRYVAWSLPPVVNWDGSLTHNWDPDKVLWDKDPDSPSYGQPLIQSREAETEIERESNGTWRLTKD